MKYTLTLALCAIFMVACNQKDAKVDVRSNSNSNASSKETLDTEGVLSKSFGFVASGENQDWELSMDFVNHSFALITMQNDSVEARVKGKLPAASKPFGEKGALYSITTTTGELLVTITTSSKKACDTNIVYNEVFDVELKHYDIEGKELSTNKGCGTYLEKYNLHDIWVLQSIDGANVAKSEKQPYLEFNLKEGKVFGFLGCNEVSGNALFYKNAVQFPTLIATKMACRNLKLEQSFLSVLAKGPYFVDYDKNSIVFRSNLHQLSFRKGD